MTSSDLAKILGFTTARIRQLEADGAIVKVERGKYDLADTIKNYVEYKENLLIEDDDDLNKLKEDTLWTRARRKKTEAELGIIVGSLHRAGDVENVMNAMMMSFRSMLLSFGSRLAPKVQGKKDLIELQEIVKDEVEDLMNELKDYDPDVFYAESDDVIAPDEPESESRGS